MSGGLNLLSAFAITVGPVETWKADKVSIWHAGSHDNPFGQRLTALNLPGFEIAVDDLFA